MGASNVGNTNNSNAINYLQNQNVDNPNKSGPSVGSGNIDMGYISPDVGRVATMQLSVTVNVRFAPNVSGEDLDVLIASVTLEMKEKVEKTEKEKIELTSEQKKNATAQKQAKEDEAVEKREEAQKKEKKASFWDKIKLAVQGIGLALAAVAAAVLIASGVGFALGALLIAGVVASAIQFTDAMIAHFAPEVGGLMGAIAIAASFSSGGLIPMPDEEALAKMNQVFGYVMMGVSLTIGIATMVAGNVGSTAALLSKAMDKGAKFLMACECMEAANNVTGAVASGVGASFRADALELQGDSMDKSAEAKQLEAILEVLNEAIDMAMQRLMQTFETFNGMLDVTVQMSMDRGKTAASARFGA